MIPAGPDRSSRAVRRAAAVAGLGSALLVLLVLLDRSLPGSGVPADGWPGTVLTAAVGLLPLVIGPAAVRVMAHPRTRPLPPQAETTAVTGVAAALCCLAAGVAVVVFEHLAARPTDTPPAAEVLLLALTGLVAAAGGVTAVELYRARPVAPAAPSVVAASARPDLVDDLATLTARALPGSPAARAMARLNRALDTWPWSARNRPLPRVVLTPRTPVIERSAVMKQPVAGR